MFVPAALDSNASVLIDAPEFSQSQFASDSPKSSHFATLTGPDTVEARPGAAVSNLASILQILFPWQFPT